MMSLRVASLLMAVLLIFANQPARTQTVHVLNAHTGPVYTARFSPDGLHVVTGSNDHRAYLWQTATGEQEYKLQAHTGYIADVVFSPDGKLVATASADLTAGIWETASGNLLRMLYGHESALTAVRFSSDGTLITTASQDNTAKVWNPATAALVATLAGHTNAVETAVFSPDNSKVATGSMDGTAKVWNATSGALLATFTPTHTGLIDIVHAVEFSPDGTRLLTSQSNDSSTVWDITSQTFQYSVPGRVARFSPDGTILTAATNGRIVAYDAATGNERYGMSTNPEYLARSIVYTTTNEPLATIAGHASLGIWDVQIADIQKNRIVKTLEGHTDYVYAAEFSPDNNHVATASRDATARLWLNGATTGIREVPSGSTGTLFCSYNAATQTIRATTTAQHWHRPVISLHNSLGTEIERRDGTAPETPFVIEFNTSQLSTGLYFVRVSSPVVHIAQPIIITR